MASDDSSGGKPAGPVVLRIKLRYDDVDTMVQRFAPNVGKSGLFLPTKAIQPLGTEIKFELRIANDTPVLVGLGKVKAFREPDPANPRAAFGMAIELMRVSREGRDVIIRMIERRRAMGLADVAIPMPEDIETAKRADVETQPRAEHSATVRSPMPDRDSTPNPIETRASQIFAAAAEKPPERKSAPSEQLLTAPRPSSGPLAIARSSSERASAPVLGPEPVRAKRPRVADLIAQATGGGASAVSVPGLDDHVDVERALARARALTSGDVDRELEALRESSAAPLVEISIEAASAELARQLGGTAINKRDRSARWAPPPAVEVPAAPPEPPTTPEPAAMPAIATPEPAPIAVTPEPAPVEGDAEPRPVVARAIVDAEPARETAPVPEPVRQTEAEARAAEREWARGAERDAEVDDLVTPVAPQPAATFVDGDSESDFRAPSASDATATSDSSDHGGAFARPATSSEEMDQLAAEAAAAMVASKGSGVQVVVREDRPPSEPVAPARPQAVLIDDDADLQSFERAFDAVRLQTGDPRLLAPEEEEIAELDDMDIEELGEHTQIGDIPGEPTPVVELADRLDEHLAAAEAEANADFPDGTLQGEELPPEDFAEEEISDLDVLAEADADDADLMQVHGERETSSSHDAAPAYPAEYEPHAHPQAQPVPPDDYDFAAQLDLDDEAPPQHAVAVDDDDDDAPSSTYTFTEDFPTGAAAGATFDDPRGLGEGEDFDEPHQFSVNTPEHNPQQFGAAPRSYSSGIEDNFDEPHGFVDGRESFEHVRPETPIAPPPYHPAREQVPAQPSVLRTAPERDSRPQADFDLENALSTLDVDLDALEVPRDKRPPQPAEPAHTGAKARPLPGMPPARAESRSPRAASPRPSHPGRPKRLKRSVTEDEGVMIDFDDDDE